LVCHSAAQRRNLLLFYSLVILAQPFYAVILSAAPLKSSFWRSLLEAVILAKPESLYFV
jgi:hypothetical protein